MKQLFIGLIMIFTLLGCTIAQDKNIKESRITPSCRNVDLSPLLVCGDYVIVKGKLNNSNNLERLNKSTMYLSEYLDENENRDIIGKNVLLSGKCSSEMIMGIPNPTGSSGGLSTMIYLNDAKLIEEHNIISVCKELKGNKNDNDYK